MDLRDYQEQLIVDSMAAAKEHGPGSGIMIQLPTGGGKTRIGGVLLLAYMAMLQGRPFVWVTHRRELSKQSSRYMNRMRVPVSIMAEESPRQRRWHADKVNVVSPALRKWPPLPGKLGVMVVDEAHHTPAATWARLVETWQFYGGIVFGLTATPWRLSKTQGFEEWYDELICGPSVTELQDKGHLATPRVRQPRGAVISDAQAKVMTTGEFEHEWMESEVSMLLAHNPVVEKWEEETKDLKDFRTMWFVPTVHCAQMLTGLLGERARVLTADTPADDRDRMLASLKHKRIDHLVSVDVLGEGIDVPSVPIIASLRPTQSVAVWLQQCGRGSRPKNKHDGGHYMVIDYAGNAQRHGTPDTPREWTLKPRQDPYTTMPQEIVARCFDFEKCSEVFLHPATRECWNCGGVQYAACSECHIHRRWTMLGKNSVCNICREYQKEEEAKAAWAAKEELKEAIKKRHDSRNDIIWHPVPKTKYQTKNARLKAKVQPYRRPVTVTEQLKLF